MRGGRGVFGSQVMILFLLGSAEKNIKGCRPSIHGDEHQAMHKRDDDGIDR